MQTDNSPARKRLTIAAVLVLVAFLAYGLMVEISHHGKVKVILDAVPDDSTIKVDGQSRSAGTIYLKPGQHSFAASHQYFDDFKTTQTINNPATIYLLPIPASDQAKNYLLKNPKVQAEREAIGGIQDQQNSQALSQQSPLIKLLPYTDFSGPFTINYGESSGKLYFAVSDSSPKGRSNALKWMRDNGADPTTMDIRFSDFSNPLTGANQ